MALITFKGLVTKSLESIALFNPCHHPDEKFRISRDLPAVDLSIYEMVLVVLLIVQLDYWH